ncbi:MAG: hypothetical protein ACRBN8_08000 [Nannocystales bacterium]
MSEPIAPPSPQTLAHLRAGFAHIPAEPGLPSTDPDQIWAAVHGPAEGEHAPDRQALIDRLHEDPQLALEWRLAAALGPIPADDECAQPQLETAPTTLRPRRVAFSAAVGVAFAAAAALALWVATAPSPESFGAPSEPSLRAPQGQPLLRTTLAADDPLPRTDVVLQWSSDLERASSFTVRVTTQDLQPVYEAHDLATTSVQVPATAVSSLPPGTVLLWRVEAIESDGRRHASEVWEFAVE